MVAWDNRRTMHCAMGYPYELSRLAYRTTLAGGMAIGAWYDGA
jgi:alpha-ketoglutarate-dependent taurine dioxygenase